MKTRIANGGTVRHIDDNGFLLVDKSPILKEGILEYYGSELLESDEEGEIDGVKVEPDKIYKVYISRAELEKAKNTFKLKPIVDEHEWLGKGGANAKDYQEGSIGENLYVEDGYLYASMQFNNLDTVNKIMAGEKEELSTSYENKLTKSTVGDYDFIASDIKGNHLALVDKGRCGSDVRILNSMGKKEEMIKKLKNEVKLTIDGKEIDLAKFFAEEGKEEDLHSGSIAEAKNEDKRALIDEIGGMLKDKVDEELWRTVIGKVEKIAYEGSESSEVDNEEDEEVDVEVDPEADDVEEEKGLNSCKASNSFERMANSLKKSIVYEAKKAESERVKAYNSARTILGDFNPFGMSAKDMYNKALSSKGVELSGKESERELAAMVKVCNSVALVDESFDYGIGASAPDEVEIKI